MPTMYANQGGIISESSDQVRREARRQAAQARVPRGTAQPAIRPPLPTPAFVNDTTQPQPPKPAGRLTRALRAAPGIIRRTAVEAGVRAMNPTSITGKAVKYLGGRVLPAISAPLAVLDQFDDDALPRYAERFGVEEPTGDGSIGDIAKSAALRVGGFASDLGDRVTLGMAGKLYRDHEAEAAPAVPALPPPGPITSARTSAYGLPGVEQDGGASFRSPGAAPLPPGDLSARNASALDALAGQYAPPRPAAPQDMFGLEAATIPDNVMVARQLLRRRATLKAAGIRDPQALQGTDAFSAVAAPDAQGLIAKTREAEMNRLTRADRAGAREERTGQMQAQTAERMNALLTQVSRLDDGSDPGGAQRAQLIQQIRSLSGDFAPLPETPAEKRRAEFAVAALKSGTPLDAETLSLIDQLAGPHEGAIYKDANGNRAKYVNGQWVEVR